MVAIALAAVACGGGSGSSEPDAVSTITVSAPLSTLEVGDTVTVQEVPKDASGHPITGLSVTWESSEPAKAVITSRGLVTAVDTGRVELTATVAHQTGSITLTIESAVATVTVTPSQDSLQVGQTVTLQAAARDSAGHALVGRPISWASSDTARASVTQGGVVTAHDSGAATITASASLKSGSASLNIRLVPVASVVLTPHFYAFSTGDTISLAAAALDATGGVLYGRRVQFANSDSSILMLSPGGRATAGFAGTAHITATVENHQDAADFVVTSCGPTFSLTHNQMRLNIGSGGVRPTTGLIGGGLFETTQVLYASGVVYGTDGAHVVLGYDPKAGAPALAPAQVCLVEDTPTLRHTFATISPLAGTTGVPALAVSEEAFDYTSAPDNGYVLFRYVFTNTGVTPIAGLTAGVLADWDLLFDGSATDDVVRFNTSLHAGEVVEADTVGSPVILALVPVASSGSRTFHGWLNGEEPGTSGGYYAFLTDSSQTTSVGPGDVRELVGRGPVTIPAHRHVVVYFAMVGGTDRAAFNANVAAAQAKASALGLQ